MGKAHRFRSEHFRRLPELMEKQWAFDLADSQAYGRLAIFRTAKEIKVTQPGLLEKSDPTVADIHYLLDRYHAYAEARQNAFKQLDSLLWQKLPGMRKGEVVEKLKRALGTPQPPDDLPYHIYIARLDALNICSESRLLELDQKRLPALSRAEREEILSFPAQADLW